MNDKKPPTGLKRSGRSLWAAVLEEFELDEHERQVLREACRTADLLDSLQTVLDREGPMAESSQGMRVHPAAVELRQQRIALARLFAALDLPHGEESGAGRTQHRGVRGVYGVGGAS
ncbi:terminase [Phycicoccus sp.]|uniref:terminase n=1 Tax=Phycicoccus sp. TaxID=1902410 RepID=UPI002CD65EA6|nr:terminase [Phycicoccus sp.]HMM93973.1 terminase [Phycicoccus sp.]